MLVVTTTMGMLHWVHSHTTNLQALAKLSLGWTNDSHGSNGPDPFCLATGLKGKTGGGCGGNTFKKLVDGNYDVLSPRDAGVTCWLGVLIPAAETVYWLAENHC